MYIPSLAAQIHLMPHCFVLMPFASEFTDVYEHLIKGVVFSEGYEVSRADEARSSRNIMHDVIHGIISADLIVVDLTGSNPNVYYELGLAHAFRKSVVLLTQDIAEVPFDLRAYRVVTYSTHFARIEEAKAQLRALAVGARDGTISFGSPVSDFGAGTALPPEKNSLAIKHQVRLELADEGGSLDIAADLSEGMSGVTRVLSEFNRRLVALQPEVSSAAELISGPIKYDPPKLRQVVRGFASSIDQFAVWLRRENGEYRKALDLMTGALDQLFSPNVMELPESKEQLPAVLAVMAGIEQSATDARVHVISLAEALEVLPKVEKEFNHAKRGFAEELRSFVSNIDQTVSVMARTQSAGEQLLGNNSAA